MSICPEEMSRINREIEENKRENDFHASLNNLKSHLNDKLRDNFPDGTVIAWLGNGRYRYAAIRSGGKWYKTGQSGYPYGFTDGVTLDVLTEKVFSRADVTRIKVAKTFVEL